MSLRSGLNVVFRPTVEDRDLLRSVFEALTGTISSGLEAQVEVDGTTVALDVGFPSLYGLDGHPPPVVDVPVAHDARIGRATSGRHRADPADQRMAELAASERRLNSELELTRRELAEQRERDAPDDPRSQVRRGGPDLHPADVAVMCDRLRELLAMDRPAEALRIAERIDDLGRRRVYRIHREEALGQLIEECRAAERSAQDYLDSVGDPPHVPGSQGGADGADRPERSAMEERFEAGTREAHTIARLDLLGELSEFWTRRLDELRAEATTGNDLLADANALLTSAGELPSGSLRDAASRLREHVRRSDYDEATVHELVESLTAYVGSDPAAVAPVELLAEAERRLAQGGVGEPGGGSSTRWRARDDQRILELEDAEHRLTIQLDAVRAEVGALQRGRDTARSHAAGAAAVTHPNPFDPPAGSRGVGDGPAADGWSFTDAVTRARTVSSVGVLPVLLLEPSEIGVNALSGVDPLAVAATAMVGQIVWVTQRPEVLSALESLGADVGIIGA